MQTLSSLKKCGPAGRRRGTVLGLWLALAGSGSTFAAPLSTTWPADGADDIAGVGASAYSGYYATADAFENRVEVRDVRGTLIRTITSNEITALLPWMSLDGGPDGPGAVGFSASGRMLFVCVHDDTIPGDGLPSDGVLRLDVTTGGLTLFTRYDLFASGASFPHLAIAHVKARLYVGDSTGTIRVWNSNRNATVGGTIAGSWPLPSGTSVRGIAIDRENTTMYAASESAVFRAPIPALPSVQPVWVQIANGSDVRGLAWAEHFGGAANPGLYILSGTGAGSARIDFLSVAQAQGGSIVTPSAYLASGADWNDLAFTGDGALLVGADEDALRITDSADTRLGYDAWLANEFAQVTTFSKGLIAPDGEPDGWVIDGDVIPAWSRFHPATPDGAAWVLFNLIMNDHLFGDPQALPLARSILTRHAGLSPDGIKPVRSADGIMKHWLEPFTGNTKGGWPDEYATLSTMKIVAGAGRAMTYWPDDPEVVRAASRIIFLTKNWDAYFQAGTDALAFIGQAGGGPQNSVWGRPFNEGIIFAEEAAVYGGPSADAVAGRWFDRSLWPTSTYISGRPITSASAGQYDSAFLSIYPALLSQPYRADQAWRDQVSNILWSNSGYTDDANPKYFTVFSAGTNPSGYNADSLTNHPNNITTFTSLEGLAAFGEESAGVAAYHAYRKGARQTFKTGASILYRRSDTDRAYSPNSAGLPDVVLGALGLAELMQPGVLDEVLAVAYPTVEQCPQDVDGDGEIDVDDLYKANAALTDLNGDGSISAADRDCLRAWLRRKEATTP